MQKEVADLESLLEYNEIVRKIFVNVDEGFQFCNTYTFDIGFSVRKSYVEWNSERNELTVDAHYRQTLSINNVQING